MSWSWWRYLHFLTSIAKCFPHFLRIFKNKGQNRYLKSLNEISLTFFYRVMRGFQYLIGEKSNSSWFLQKIPLFKVFYVLSQWDSFGRQAEILMYLFIENEINFMIYSVGITTIFNLHFRVLTKWYLLQTVPWK